MENFFILLFVKLVDPTSFIIATGVSYFSNKKWIIAISGITAYLGTELLLTMTNSFRVFGSNFIPLFLGSLLHGFLAYWLINKFRSNTQKSIKKS